MQTKSLLNLSLVVVMLTGFSACQRSDDEEPTSSTSETLVNSHAISVEEALSSLDNFLKDSPTRAAGSLPKVTDVIPMKLEQTTTRAMMAKNADNLIYVANFTNDNGFAILAADDRIKEKVIVRNPKHFHIMELALTGML